MFPNRPMTPEELAKLRRRMDTSRTQLTYGPMATDIGTGLGQIGTAIGYRMMKNRYDSQFPDAPGGSQPNPIVQALIGRGMKSQFPQAPQPAPQPMPQPVQQPQATAPVINGGGGLLAGLFGRKTGGGLY